MNKVIKDGLVAVLYSPGYGAGWHTWGAPIEAVFDPDLVNAVLEDDYDKAVQIANTKWPDEFDGGVRDLEVKWIPEGTRFIINEYDGSESIQYLDDVEFLTA